MKEQSKLKTADVWLEDALGTYVSNDVDGWSSIYASGGRYYAPVITRGNLDGTYSLWQGQIDNNRVCYVRSGYMYDNVDRVLINDEETIVERTIDGMGSIEDYVTVDIDRMEITIKIKGRDIEEDPQDTGWEIGGIVYDDYYLRDYCVIMDEEGNVVAAPECYDDKRKFSEEERDRGVIYVQR